MSKTERYIRAAQSSNLRDDEHNHGVEPLMSMAFSKVQMASVLYRTKYLNDAHCYPILLGHLIAALTQKSMSRSWPAHIVPKRIAEIALKYWINPICYICRGRGEDVKINQYGGIDRECQACNSMGKRPIHADTRVIGYVMDAVSWLDEGELEILRTMRR